MPSAQVKQFQLCQGGFRGIPSTSGDQYCFTRKAHPPPPDKSVNLKKAINCMLMKNQSVEDTLSRSR